MKTWSTMTDQEKMERLFDRLVKVETWLAALDRDHTKQLNEMADRQDKAAAFLQALRDSGVPLAVDDVELDYERLLELFKGAFQPAQ